MFRMHTLAAAGLALVVAAPAAATTTITYTFSASGIGEYGRYLGAPGASPFETSTVVGAIITFVVPDAGNRNVLYTGIDAGEADIAVFDTGLYFGYYSPSPFSYGAVTGSGSACFSNPTANFPTGNISLSGGGSCGSVTYRKQGRYSYETFTGTINSVSVSSFEGLSSPLASIASVIPEPSTWALMLAGFAITGYALRKRRVSVALAPTS